jgi:hypothetical protein
MKKNFTQFISEVSKARQFTFAIATLLLLIASAAYLRAAVGVSITGAASYTLSADLAIGTTFTPITDVRIAEGANNDFASGQVYRIRLSAPSGWVFSNSGVNPARNAGGEVTLNTTPTYITDAAGVRTIEITLTAGNGNQNKPDEILISGLSIKSTNGVIDPTQPKQISIQVLTGSATVASANPVSLSQVAGAAKQLAFITQPSNAETGAIIAPAPRVAIQDQFGNTVTNASNAVTLAIGNNPSSGTLATGTSATANGVVTFLGYSIDRAGTGYTLIASGTGLTSVTSNAFNVNSKVPTLATLPATCVTQGAGDLTLTVSGTNFERNSVVRVDGVSRTTTYISSTQLQVLIPAADLALSGNRIITVLNPAPPSNNISNPQTLVVNPAMRVATIIGEREVCAGKDVLYEAPSGFTNYNWSVTQGAGVLEPTNNPAIVRFEPTVPVSGKVTISVTATNACNSTSTASFDVTVLPTPIAVIAYDSPAICAGTSQILSVASAPAGDTYTYQWFKGTTVGGATSPIGTNSPSLSVTEAGVYIVTVTGLNKCPRTSDPVEITVDPLPVATITTSGSTTFCEGGQVTLTAEGGDTYLWSNGSTNKSITVDASGTYTVQVTDGNSCTSEPSAPVTVTENPLPVATITPEGPTTFCQGGSVTLTASAGESWLWSNGATTQSITVSAGGSFTVIVTDANGCTSAASAPVNVVVNPLPVATITAGGPTTFCQGGTVTLTASGGNSYLWSNGATTPSITVDASGTFTVRVTDANSCTSAPSAPVTVTVNPLPTVSITPTGPLQFCEGNSVVLVPTALPTGDTFTYAWFNAADNSEVETTKDYVATTSGDYYLVVTNQNGCQQTSQTLTVIVAELPTEANITLEGASTFCQGGSLKLSANKSPDNENPYTYKWFKNDVEIPNETSETYIANESGDYQVEVTNLVEDCSKLSAKVKVTALPQPVATITSSSDQKCLGAGNTTVFTVTGDFSGGTAQWLTSNPAFVIGNPVYDASTGKATATITASGTGTSTITLRTTNNAASCSTANSAVTLTVNPLPSATITAGGPTTFCQDGSVVLSAPQGAGYTYQWFRDGAAIATAGTGQQYTAVQSGGYTVEVTNSATGCVATTPTATNVAVNPQPTAAITGTDQAKCIGAGNSTSFTVSGTFSGGTAQWVSSNNSFQVQNPVYNTTTGQATATIVVTGTGTATITLRTSNSVSACNTAESTTTLTVDPLPSTTITAGGPTTFCQGGSVVLSAPQGDYSYQWLRNGTAITTDGTAKDYTAFTAGNYTVRVTNNTTTCVATTATATTVTVNPQPVVSAASASPAAKCVGTGNVTVFDLTGSIANGTPSWTVVGTTGGATVSNISSPNTTGTQVTVAGVGTVTMRLSSSSSVASCTTASRDVTLTVHPMPIANAGPDQALCAGATNTRFFRQASGSSSGENNEIAWTVKSTDPGLTVTNLAHPFNYNSFVDVSGVGNVVLLLTVTTNGCTTTDEVVYTVKPTPVITPIANKTYCNGAPGEAINFASSVAGSSISWTSSANVGFGTSGTGNIPAFTAINTGTTPLTTTVRVNATANGCSASQMSFSITVYPTPKLTNIPATTPQICSESVFNYTPTVSPSGATTSWSRAAVAGISNPASSGTGSVSETLINTTTTAKTVTYVYTVTANGCSNTHNVPVIVNPKPVITSISLGSDNDSDGDGKFADVYTGQAALPLAGTPSDGTFRVNGTTATSFNPCTLGAGTHTITYTRTQGSCTTVVSKTVTVRQSTYRAVITANPHPFCRGGGGTTYTTAVYRDVQPGEIIYPYLVDANGSPVDAAGNPIPKGGGNYPVPNPNYPFPAGTPESIKELAYRFFQPIVSDALASRKIDQNLFTYQWGKNDEINRKNDTYITSDAGLSSQDYYEVDVRSSSLCGPVTLESNRMYSAVLDNYVITLTASPNPICQGAAVTFTGTLGAGFPWAIANLQLQVVLVRTNTVLYSSGYTGDSFQFTTDAASVGGFINGDRVEVRFTTSINSYLPSNNCIEGPIANSTVINVNDIVAVTPTDQSQTICLNGTATFNAPVTTTGPTTVTYTWNVGGMTYTTTVPTLTVSTPRTATAGAYPVSVVVANSCETTTTLSLGTLTVKPAITMFTVSGNASFCQGSTTGTFPVTLSGSQTGVNYTLVGGTSQTLAGTGGPLVFNVPKSVATYTVQAAYATAPGCVTSMTGNAVITQDSLPTVTVNSPSVCAGQTATVTAVPAGGSGTYTSYIWTVPAGWSGPLPTTASFQTTVPGTYTVKVTDNKSCVSSAAATSIVTINPLPTVTVSSPTTCQGTTTTVAATVANGTGPYNYAWTVPSGPNPGNVASFQTGIAGTYTVVVTDSKGCASASGSGTVTITPTQIARGSITAENARGPISESNPIKTNEPVTFTVTTDIAPTDVRLYSWYVGSEDTGDWGTGPIASGTSNSFTMTPTIEAPFDVKVEVATAAEACYSSVVFITDSPITPLPVELMYFKATRRQNNAVLTWATAMEKNNEGFEVQVSQDGVNYRQLQFVPTKNGNTSIKQTYEFVDKENGKFGTRYYRLRQLDSDGQYAYYGPQMVIFGDVVNSVFVYPNPFEREVKLDVDSEKDATMEVTLTDLMGKKLMTKSIDVAKGRSSAVLDLGEGLPAGIYIVTTRLNGITTNFKLMKK